MCLVKNLPIQHTQIYAYRYAHILVNIHKNTHIHTYTHVTNKHAQAYHTSTHYILNKYHAPEDNAAPRLQKTTTETVIPILSPWHI